MSASRPSSRPTSPSRLDAGIPGSRHASGGPVSKPETQKWYKRLMPKLPSLRSVAVAPHDLELTPEVQLGKGGHAQVVTGRYKGRKVAVKVLPADDSHTISEVSAFRALGGGHANVVSSFPVSTSTDKRRVYLPLEVCEEDLLSFTDAKEGLEEFEAAALFLAIVRGVRYMHSCGVYHLDIKPENVLLRDGVPKLADFGTAVQPPSKHVTVPCGTPIYGSPEAVAAHNVVYAPAPRKPTPSPLSPPPIKGSAIMSPSGQTVASSQTASSATGGAGGPQSPAGIVPYSPEKADVWSLAVSLFVLVTGFFPWKHAALDEKRYAAWASTYTLSGKPRTNESIFKRIFGKAVSQRGTPFSLEFMDLIRRALHPVESQRLTLRQFEAHPFFKSASIVQAIRRSIVAMPVAE